MKLSRALSFLDTENPCRPNRSNPQETIENARSAQWNNGVDVLFETLNFVGSGTPAGVVSGCTTVILGMSKIANAAVHAVGAAMNYMRGEKEETGYHGVFAIKMGLSGAKSIGCGLAAFVPVVGQWVNGIALSIDNIDIVNAHVVERKARREVRASEALHGA